MGFNKSYQKYKGRSKGENVDQPVSLSRLSTCLQAHSIVFKRGGGIRNLDKQTKNPTTFLKILIRVCRVVVVQRGGGLARTTKASISRLIFFYLHLKSGGGGNFSKKFLYVNLKKLFVAIKSVWGGGDHHPSPRCYVPGTCKYHRTLDKLLGISRICAASIKIITKLSCMN